MKRLFTFLATIMALFSFAQNAMAEDVYLLTAQTINGVKGTYALDFDYSKVPVEHKMSLASGTEYTLTITEMPTDAFYFRIGSSNFDQKQMQPWTNGDTAPINSGRYTVKSDANFWGKEKAWKVTGYKGKYDYLVVHVTTTSYNVNKEVWVEGKNYEKQDVYLLTSQKINGKTGTYVDQNNKNYSSVPAEHKLTQVGSSTTYKLDITPSSSDAEFSFRLGVNGWDNNIQPYTNDSPLTVYEAGSTHTAYTISEKCYGWDKAWKVAYDQSAYTNLTLYVDVIDGANRRVWIEGTKTNDQSLFTLLNGGSEYAQNKTGQFTYNLADASNNASVSFKIGTDNYGFESAQSVTAEGDYSFTATKGATGTLTLTKGFAYTIGIDGEGNVKVTAKKQQQFITSDAGYYLVGNFFSSLNKEVVTPGPDDVDNINYNKLYFKFDKVSANKYQVNIPACLTAKMQILAVNADGTRTVFGPDNSGQSYGLHGDGYGDDGKGNSTSTKYDSAWPATNGKADGTLTSSTTLEAGNIYWNLETRNDGGTDDDGMYKVFFTLGTDGTPSTWEIQHDANTRVAYLLSTAYGATAQPVYNTRSKAQGSYSDNTEAYLHFDSKNSYYAIGYVVNDVSGSNVTQLNAARTATPSIHATASVNNNSGTHNKLFFLGNAGYEYNDSEHNKVWANQKPFTLNIKGTKKVQYNPNRGYNDLAGTDGTYGSTGSLYIQNPNTVDYPNTISMVGTAIPGTINGDNSWNWASTAADMTYDANERCYKVTIETTDGHKHQAFRFVGDHKQAYNWHEDTTTEETKKAGCDHQNTTGHRCTPEDPNLLNYTIDGENNNTEDDYNIMWNREAGLHVVKFYITTDENNQPVYKYTIESTNNKPLPLILSYDKFIRTYSNDKAMDVVSPNVKVYEAYRYDQPSDKTEFTAKGTMHMRQLNYIPANVGVVLIGEVPANGSFDQNDKLNIDVRERTSDIKDDLRDVWTKGDTYKKQNDAWHNFLVPTVTAVTNLGNWKVEGDKVLYRYFGLDNFHSTNYYKENQTGDDYIGFFRLTPNGRSGANKAYLSMPAAKDIDGGEYGYIDFNGQFIGATDENNAAMSKMMLAFDDLENGGVTEIKYVNVERTADNAYYNLQGIKVDHPVKGIYIHNGKKIVIK